MLEDLDKEMDKRSFEAVIVIGEGNRSIELYYFVRVQIPRGGIYLKRIDEKPVLIVGNVDVKRAEKSVVRDVKTFTEYGYEELVRKYGPSKAEIYFYDSLIHASGVEGRIGVYGDRDSGAAYNLLKGLESMDHKVVGESRPSLVDKLMEIKSESELSEIKKVGSLVDKVLTDTMDMICDKLSKGKEVTLGDAKKNARILMTDVNLNPVEDFAISSGEDTADPHNLGEDHKKIEMNTPILIDLYPRSSNLLYFDITRTHVVGRASREVKRMHEDVTEAQAIAFDGLREGINASELMETVCKFFEEKGHPTVTRLLNGDASKLERGFMHSLGHGVGWSLSDLPVLSLMSEDRLRKGQVFTLEPGLYEPKVGGVRVEDVYSLAGGNVEQISKLDKTLEM